MENGSGIFNSQRTRHNHNSKRHPVKRQVLITDRPFQDPLPAWRFSVGTAVQPRFLTEANEVNEAGTRHHSSSLPWRSSVQNSMVWGTAGKHLTAKNAKSAEIRKLGRNRFRFCPPVVASWPFYPPVFPKIFAASAFFEGKSIPALFPW